MSAGFIHLFIHLAQDLMVINSVRCSDRRSAAFQPLETCTAATAAFMPQTKLWFQTLSYLKILELRFHHCLICHLQLVAPHSSRACVRNTDTNMMVRLCPIYSHLLRICVRPPLGYTLNHLRAWSSDNRLCCAAAMTESATHHASRSLEIPPPNSIVKIIGSSSAIYPLHCRCREGGSPHFCIRILSCFNEISDFHVNELNYDAPHPSRLSDGQMYLQSRTTSTAATGRWRRSWPGWSRTGPAVWSPPPWRPCSSRRENPPWPRWASRRTRRRWRQHRGNVRRRRREGWMEERRQKRRGMREVDPKYRLTLKKNTACGGRKY